MPLLLPVLLPLLLPLLLPVLLPLLLPLLPVLLPLLLPVLLLLPPSRAREPHPFFRKTEKMRSGFDKDCANIAAAIAIVTSAAANIAAANIAAATVINTYYCHRCHSD